MMPPPLSPTEEEDPYQSEEYQRFVEECAKTCMATDSPCDSCLAGGICDGPDKPDLLDDPQYDRDEYRAMTRTTKLSLDRLYRYLLWREWDEDILARTTGARPDEYLMVIGLNPSKADESVDDPTIRKCIGFAKRWGFGALCMTNLFALRATQPSAMLAHPHPIGDGNEAYLHEAAEGAGMILAAWGCHGSHLGRDAWAKRTFPDLKCLRRNADGSPMHPLYVPYETRPVTWREGQPR